MPEICQKHDSYYDYRKDSEIVVTVTDDGIGITDQEKD